MPPELDDLRAVACAVRRLVSRSYSAIRVGVWPFTRRVFTSVAATVSAEGCHQVS